MKPSPVRGKVRMVHAGVRAIVRGAMGTVVNLRAVPDELPAPRAVPAPPVRIAASPTVADWWLPSALVRLESGQDHHLVVEVVTANSTIVREMVRSGRCDVGLAATDPTRPDSGLVETHVWADEIIVAVP